MKIEQVKVSDLKASTYNPRKWDTKTINDLTESVKRFGMIDPLIANGAPKRKNILIGGHLRLKIAKDLNFTEVPVVYVDIADIEQEKELNLRLNRNIGAWDEELLKEFDTSLLLQAGFTTNELDEMLNDVIEVTDDGFNVKKEIESIVKPVTQPGDIFRLGSHRLICSSSLDLDSVRRLTANENVSMIYCDPPYNIGLDYRKGIGTKGKYTPNKLVNDNKKIGEYRDFIDTSVKNALAIANNDTHVFFWCDERYIWLVQKIYEANGIANKRVCLWIKNNINPTPQVAFNKVYEPCIYGTRGNPTVNKDIKNLSEILNKEINCTGLFEDLMSQIQIWLIKRDNTTEYEHPTQKPITLNEKPIKRCTGPGGIVLDLFGGSGSTLIACEQLKRRAFLVELDPAYCDLIIRRYEHFTGDHSVKVESFEG